MQNIQLKLIKPVQTKSLKQQALAYAHVIKRYCNSWQEALQLAWNKIRILHHLSQPLTYFEYVKKSTGELVDRMGTLCEDSFDYVYKRSYMYQRWYIVKYWDLSVMDWRSFDLRTLKKIHW